MKNEIRAYGFYTGVPCFLYLSLTAGLHENVVFHQKLQTSISEDYHLRHPFSYPRHKAVNIGFAQDCYAAYFHYTKSCNNTDNTFVCQTKIADNQSCPGCENRPHRPRVPFNGFLGITGIQKIRQRFCLNPVGFALFCRCCGGDIHTADILEPGP